MTVPAREEQWAAWMRAAIAGDTHAYHRFLTDITPYLRAMARRRCGRFGTAASEAEDVVQEVLLAIHVKRGSWDEIRPIGPWVSTIVRNKFIDSLRRRGRQVHVPIEDVVAILEADDRIDPGDRIDIEHILGNLKHPQRTIVSSVSIEGKSIRETAGLLNMSEGAVRVSLHRALKALAALYRGE